MRPATQKQTFYLDNDESALLLAVDGLLDAWMRSLGATPTVLPPLLPAAELDRISYFSNFPHLANVVCRVHPEADLDLSTRALSADDLHDAQLSAAELVVPSAACYGVYLQRAGQVIDQPCLITSHVAVARAETEYVPLRRLRSYHVRELVYIGDHTGAGPFVESVHDWLRRLVAVLSLDATTKTAVDAFFDAESSTATLQRMSKAKQELVYGGDLAVGSVNYHRNFFGEAYDIRDVDGQYVHTACFGAGLERWVAMISERAGGADAGRELIETLHRTLIAESDEADATVGRS